MNTYFVEVNAHFLTRLDYDGSAAGAEHYFLDKYHKAVWGANAYDEKAMKTECFRSALLTSELVELNTLERLLTATEQRMDDYKEWQKKLAEIDSQIAEHEREHERLRKERAELVQDMEYPERKFREYVEKSHCERPN